MVSSGEIELHLCPPASINHLPAYRLPSRLRARRRASHGYTIRRAIRTSRSHFIGTSVSLEPDRPKSERCQPVWQQLGLSVTTTFGKHGRAGRFLRALSRREQPVAEPAHMPDLDESF